MHFRLRLVVMRIRKSIWLCDCGSALVEAAIALPLFLMLVGGVLELSFYLYQEQLITSGVRDGARYLALANNPNSADHQRDAKNIAVYGAPSGGMSPRVAGWTPDNVRVIITTASNAGMYSGAAQIPIVTVSTAFTDQSLGFLGMLGFNAPTISASHQERWVGGSF
jgi:Flp pilus assembly protein TadG